MADDLDRDAVLLRWGRSRRGDGVQRTGAHLRDRQLARYRSWLATRASFPAAWRAAAGDSEYVFYLTPDELKALNEDLLEFLLPRFRERLTDPAMRPAGSALVEMLVFSYPISPPS